MTDKTYREELRDEIESMLEEIGESEPILTADLDRTNVYPLLTAVSAFAMGESPIETEEDNDKRVRVAAHALTLMDAQLSLSAMKLGESTPEDQNMNVTIRLPESLARTVFLGALYSYLQTPSESGMEREFNKALAAVADEWPEVSKSIQELMETSVADFDPGMTDIDIQDPYDVNDEE